MLLLAVAGCARRSSLARRLSDVNVCEAEDSLAAGAMISSRNPPCGLVVDLELPGPLVVTALLERAMERGLRDISAIGRVIDTQAARTAIAMGICVYPREDSVQALRRLVVPWRIAAIVPIGHSRIVARVSQLYGLTRLQESTLALLLAEKGRDEIADVLMCSLSAVRGSMARVARRLGVASAVDAARVLRQRVLAETHDNVTGLCADFASPPASVARGGALNAGILRPST